MSSERNQPVSPASRRIERASFASLVENDDQCETNIDHQGPVVNIPREPQPPKITGSIAVIDRIAPLYYEYSSFHPITTKEHFHFAEIRPRPQPARHI